MIAPPALNSLKFHAAGCASGLKYQANPAFTSVPRTGAPLNLEPIKAESSGRIRALKVSQVSSPGIGRAMRTIVWHEEQPGFLE